MPLTESEGPYAGLLYEYVSYRTALGFVVPASTRRILRHMADYLYTLPLIPEVIDRERAEEISAAREGESDRTRQSRFVALRQLCLWLRRTGVGAYVPPPGQARARNDFVPRIVSEDEMARIIGVAESGTLPWVPMVSRITTTRARQTMRCIDSGGEGVRMRRREPYARKAPCRRNRSSAARPSEARRARGAGWQRYAEDNDISGSGPNGCVGILIAA